jgi:hypothetical protein
MRTIFLRLCQFRMIQKIAGMQSFKQYGCIVDHEITKQLFTVPGIDNIGQASDERIYKISALVVKNLFAEFVEFFGWFPSILKSMQVYFHSCIVKVLQLVKNINHSAIVGRKRIIKGDYM